MTAIIKSPVKKIEIDPQLKNFEDKEQQVIVHCRVYNPGVFFVIWLKAWKTTFLVEKETGRKCQILHAKNISFHPVKTFHYKRGYYHFTLIFSGLSKSCKSFDLVEEIPEPGEFSVKNIQRNESDVYSVEL